MQNIMELDLINFLFCRIFNEKISECDISMLVWRVQKLLSKRQYAAETPSVACPGVLGLPGLRAPFLEFHADLASGSDE